MCNVGLILGLVIGAEIAFGIATGLMIAGAALSGNWFTGGGSIALISAALISIAVAITTLGGAMYNLQQCRQGPCGPFALTAWNLSVGATTALIVLTVTCALCLPAVVIPAIGLAVAIGMVASMLASAALFLGIADQVARMEACRTASVSAAGVIAIVIAVANFILVLFAFGALGTEFGGGGTCVGPNC